VQARLADFDVGCDLYAWFDGGVAESGAWRRILASAELLDSAYGC
jgi:hypothetical protein